MKASGEEWVGKRYGWKDGTWWLTGFFRMHGYVVVSACQPPIFFSYRLLSVALSLSLSSWCRPRSSSIDRERSSRCCPVTVPWLHTGRHISASLCLHSCMRVCVHVWEREKRKMGMWSVLRRCSCWRMRWVCIKTALSPAVHIDGWIFLSLSLSSCGPLMLSVWLLLPLPLPVCLSGFFSPSPCLSVCLSGFFSPSPCLSACLSGFFSPSPCLSACLSEWVIVSVYDRLGVRPTCSPNQPGCGRFIVAVRLWMIKFPPPPQPQQPPALVVEWSGIPRWGQRRRREHPQNCPSACRPVCLPVCAPVHSRVPGHLSPALSRGGLLRRIGKRATQLRKREERMRKSGRDTAGKTSRQEGSGEKDRVGEGGRWLSARRETVNTERRGEGGVIGLFCTVFFVEREPAYLHFCPLHWLASDCVCAIKHVEDGRTRRLCVLDLLGERNRIIV